MPFQVTFSAKLDPAEKVTFNLRYEELLQRSEQGKYHYEVNIQPKNQKIADFKIKVSINESLPLDGISITPRNIIGLHFGDLITAEYDSLI